MEMLSYKQIEANKAFSILRKMFNMTETRRYPNSTFRESSGLPPFSGPGRGVAQTKAPLTPNVDLTNLR